jgi:integrase
MAVVRNGKRWGVRIYNPASQKMDWVGSFDTYREACAVEEAHKKRGKRSGTETCGSFARRWIDDYPRATESTNDSYRQVAEMFAAEFPDTPLDALTRSQARAWTDGKGYRVNAMRAMFNDALKDELVDSNPFASMGLPQSRGRRDLLPLTQAEVDEIGECALRVHPGPLGLTIKAISLTIAYCGIRPGEVFALERGDVDWEAGQIHVWQRVDRKGRRGKPKKKKPRVHVLHPTAAAAIRAVPASLSPVLLPAPGDEVFTNPRFLYYWRGVRTAFEAGLSEHRRRQLQASRPERAVGLEPYELRHAGGHWVLEATRDLYDTSIFMGHADGGKEVLKTYGHPDADAARSRLRASFGQKVVPLRAVDEEASHG